MATQLRPVSEPICHRFFLGLMPPPEVAARIGALRDSLSEPGSSVADDRLHITLLSLPDFTELPEGLAETIVEAAAEVEAPGFPIVLDRLISGPHSVLLCPSESLDGLRMFRERLGFTLMRAGLGLRLGRRFNPHVTLLYNSWRTYDDQLDDPIHWRAEDFVLIHSLVGLTEHRELGRWPLKG